MTTRMKGVLAFLVISFGMSWAWLLLARLGLGLSLVNPLVQLPFGFAPAMAAIVVRRWITREGFRDAGLAPRLRGAWSSYLVAWLGPMGLVVATVGLAVATGLWNPDPSALDGAVPGLPGWALVLLLMVAVPLLTPFYWGEEFGWTSYLRLRIFVGRPLMSATVTGLIWAVWHYPLAFLGYIEFTNVLLGLLVWTVGFLLQEIILAWLRSRSDSIWPPSLAHAGNNMVLALLTGLLLSEGGGLGEITVMLLTAVPMAVVCVWILAGRRLAVPRAVDDQAESAAQPEPAGKWQRGVTPQAYRCSPCIPEPRCSTCCSRVTPGP
ncbi:type II CAAX endopeptidase family protein [Micromonospora sp. WMMD1076]|uniref:CPBP family intramembrane glutamic endopeptidase n=1 Tax=Micromonospora sp. WMMD1076 TaxID=3016103 RepID=UPI002499F3DD|nr:type II CAAX endopeptidase family protein [Micromonospora sp. WMMD1076]WFF09183.1 type II CAAX endopeptidase family protein [Micromonospora sp. WMMD1076]